MRVQINAGGREVIGECPDTGTSIRELFTEALVIWRCTEGAKVPSDGPAGMGFIAEAAGDRAASTSMPDMEVTR